MVDFWYASARGLRPTMEDRHVVAERAGWLLFAVLDGHGGREVVDQAADWLPAAVLPVLIVNTGRSSIQLKTVVHRIVVGLDRRLYGKLGQTTKSGCTLLLSAYHPASRRLIMASVGDSRGIIRTADGSLIQTTDHKPDDPAEKARIEAAGSFVDRGRVGRILAMSRAVGDFPLKKLPNDGIYDAEAGPVSAAPQVLVGYADGPTTVVLACDGVFDVMDSSTAVSIVDRPATNPADSLMREAFRLGSRDNITALVVRIPAG